ncbi:MAG: CBS domain-containing protein [Hyphomicrobiales bacterium]|nr:CBS domain-containing protein [Hyphomicrobiales bacterium]
MNVAAILADKGHEIFTATPEQTLDEICRFLAEKRIGAALITDPQEKLVGIVTERDIVRAIARKGGAVLKSRVAAYMTQKVVTCTESDSINEIMERMTAGNFRHMPVVENGRIIGVISNRDVVRRRIRDIEREAEEMRSYIATA